MNRKKFEAKVFQRVMEKMAQKGLAFSQPASVPEAVHELARYLDSDDRAYMNDRGQLVLESDGDTSTESNRRLAMAIRQLKHVAEGLGLALQPDLRPTAFRVPEAGLFCSVATFDFSLSGSVQEATEQELDSAARRAGFTKNRDGWVINERRAGGPYGLAYAFVIPEKNGLKWSVMDRIGGNVGNGFDAPNPGLFAKVKAMYDRGKNKPGDVPDRTLASVQEGVASSLPWKKINYQREAKYKGYTFAIGEKKKKGIWVGVVKPSQPLIVDTIGYFPNEQAAMAAVDRYISSHESVSERPFEAFDWEEGHQYEASRNQIGTGAGQVRARAREGMSWMQKQTAGGPGWLGKWQGSEIEVWVVEVGQTPTSNQRPYWSARGKTKATASGYWEDIGKFTTASQAKQAAERWAADQ